MRGVAIALWVMAGAVFAQPQLGPTELARAKSLLDLYKAELSAEQYGLLSSKLAQTQQAYVELTVATGETAAAAAETATVVEAVAAGGRAVLGGIADVLPLLIFVYPSTAHAPGMKEEKPQVRAAKAKLEQNVKELAEATRKVEAEREAAVARTPKPTLQRCLDSCSGTPEVREAFCRTLPVSVRKRCWEVAQEKNPEICRNMCRGIFLR